MMLRSSSTPVLGSLLPPENPNHHHDTTIHPHNFSFHHQISSPGSHHFTTLSCTSSPISPSFSNGGLRRAQSEGNLESLMSSGCKDDEFSFFKPPKKSPSRLHSSLLETIPSFSYHNSNFKSDDDEFTDDEEQDQPHDEGFGEFRGFNTENKVLMVNKLMEFGNLSIKDDIGGSGSGSQMYIAKGIGVDEGFGCGGGGGRNHPQVSHGGGGGGGGGNDDVEEHYRKMVNENPANALFLGNYAQFLYQSKQDLIGAEEYYSRAILVDPNDGEILSQYGKLLWELHHDKDRAISYFERAVRAASEDSHVHAAYASFLWEIEDEDEEEEGQGFCGNIQPLFNNGTIASATV